MINNVVFLGDSLTSGENNNYTSFAHYYKDSSNDNVFVLGLSGSCFGNYSIYPVNQSLFDMLNSYNFIYSADTVFIEFGINDVASVISSYVDLQQVYIAIVRALDLIQQKNSNIKIIFLLPFKNIPYEYCDNYVGYLLRVYFKDYPIDIQGPLTFKKTYNSLVNFIELNHNVIFMNEYLLNNSFENYLDKDGIHLNDSGYRLVAANLATYLKENNL